MLDSIFFFTSNSNKLGAEGIFVPVLKVSLQVVLVPVLLKGAAGLEEMTTHLAAIETSLKVPLPPYFQVNNRGPRRRRNIRQLRPDSGLKTRTESGRGCLLFSIFAQ